MSSKEIHGSGTEPFNNTLKFLAEVSSISIQNKGIYQDPFGPEDQRWEIVGAYFGTNATLEEIGKEYGTTCENIRQIIKRALRKLYQTSSPTVQNSYSIGDLGLRKPESFRSAKRKSLAHGGKFAELERLASTGELTFERAREITGLNGRGVSVVRNRLQKWGIEIPYANGSNRMRTQSK